MIAKGLAEMFLLGQSLSAFILFQHFDDRWNHASLSLRRLFALQASICGQKALSMEFSGQTGFGRGGGYICDVGLSDNWVGCDFFIRYLFVVGMIFACRASIILICCVLFKDGCLDMENGGWKSNRGFRAGVGVQDSAVHRDKCGLGPSRLFMWS